MRSNFGVMRLRFFRCHPSKTFMPCIHHKQRIDLGFTKLKTNMAGIRKHRHYNSICERIFIHITNDYHKWHCHWNCINILKPPRYLADQMRNLCFGIFAPNSVTAHWTHIAHTCPAFVEIIWNYFGISQLVVKRNCRWLLCQNYLQLYN